MVPGGGEKEKNKAESYEDLDELVIRLVQPLAANLRALPMHLKWNESDWDTAQVRECETAAF